MVVLATDCGYTADSSDDLLAATTSYKDALEELCVDLAEKLERRGPGAAPAASSSPAAAAGPVDQLELRRGTQRWRIVHHLAGLTDLFASEGKTAAELSSETGMPLNSISTRMSELITGGWVSVCGERNGKSSYLATSKAVSYFQGQDPLAV